jgi:hypothetical protein
LKAFVSELEHLQGHSPELGVIIFGGVPESRIAAFCEMENQPKYYVIPYPE